MRANKSQHQKKAAKDHCRERMTSLSTSCWPRSPKNINTDSFSPFIRALAIRGLSSGVTIPAVINQCGRMRRIAKLCKQTAPRQHSVSDHVSQNYYPPIRTTRTGNLDTHTALKIVPDAQGADLKRRDHPWVKRCQYWCQGLKPQSRSNDIRASTGVIRSHGDMYRFSREILAIGLNGV